MRVKGWGVSVPTTALPLDKSITAKLETAFILFNQGATSVWARTDGSIATAASPSLEIQAGTSKLIWLTPEDGDSVISLIAVTNPVNVFIQQLTFRSSLLAEIVGAAASLAVFILQTIWAPISSTRVQLTGSYIEASADTYSGKTVQTNVRVGQPGNPTFATPCLIGPSSSDFIEVGTNGVQMENAGAVRVYMDNGGVFKVQNTYSLGVYNGGGTDPRFLASPTAVTRFTPVAGGQISETLFTVWKVIKNGVTLNAGDLAEYDVTSGFRVQAAAAGSANQGVGRVITGGTGNAGGTVLAEIANGGMMAQTFLADVAGVVQGQYVYQGATNAGRLASKTTNERTIGIALQTAGSGVAVDVELTGAT